ncbi:TonB-dependent receptor [Sphingomonas pokkalii]|uniref:TonB-dependent receptor n=1 Tax=Sphingomonas pokkalii TaxID=2175090 RepID=A0A2U0SGL4_9SPHN|nr:TonB-dependent receptor [Sphingomonas pokkalii]PVX30482.1 TonB-dependent receptor [Sphingomonas pokkalii]
MLHLARTKRCLLIGAAIGALFTTNIAMAQQADGNDGLNEIVVTAERRPENQQDVPVSVAVIPASQARDYTASGDDTLLALSGKVPGLYVESSTGRIFPRFYIRGLGNVDFYLGASQPVSIIQDDIVLEHVVLKSNPVFDVNQIEVLRGPQGSLFGRNTTAGIIKFDTIRPSQTYEGRATASYGSYNSVNIDAGVGGPIIQDKLAFRISALYQHRDDYIDNSYAGPSADGTTVPKKNAAGGFNERDVRLQLLATPTETLSILASGHARWYDGTATVFRRGALNLGSNKITGVQFTSARWDEGADNPQRYDTAGGSLHVNWDLGGVTLTSITGYETLSGRSRGDTDGGAAADFGNAGFGESMGRVKGLDQWTEEFRVASNGAGPLKWQVGAMYFDSRDITDFYQRGYFLTGTARNPNNWVRLHNMNTSWALFGQVSYEIAPKLTITAGGRVTEDTKTTDLLKTADTAAGVVTYTGRRHVRLSDTQPSWDLSARYEINPDVSVYARVAKGFRGPTIQGRSAVFNADFTTANSEKILSWEAGVKSQIGRTLRFNLSGFYYTVDDIQLNGNDANGNGVLLNANKAKAYGMEADLDWRPVRNLSIQAGLSLLHSEIDDKNLEAQVCAFGGAVTCTVLDPLRKQGSLFLAKIDGNPLPNAPEYNLSLNARYDIPLANSGRVFVATDWNLQGYTNFVLYETKEFTANGNFEGGLKIGYAAPNDAWELAGFVRNITNEMNLKGVIENYRAAVLNEPRVFGVSLSGKFK